MMEVCIHRRDYMGSDIGVVLVLLLLPWSFTATISFQGWCPVNQSPCTGLHLLKFLSLTKLRTRLPTCKSLGHTQCILRLQEIAVNTGTKVQNQSKCRVAEPSPSGDDYKTLERSENKRDERSQEPGHQGLCCEILIPSNIEPVVTKSP